MSSESVAFEENSDLFFTYFLAEALGCPVEEIEKMDSKRFENWRTYYSVKAQLERKMVREEREKIEAEAKAKQLPKGTMYWRYD